MTSPVESVQFAGQPSGQMVHFCNGQLPMPSHQILVYPSWVFLILHRNVLLYRYYCKQLAQRQFSTAHQKLSSLVSHLHKRYGDPDRMRGGLATALYQSSKQPLADDYTSRYLE